MDPEYREQLTKIEDLIEEYLEKILEIIDEIKLDQDLTKLDYLEDSVQNQLNEIREVRAGTIQ